MTAQSEYYLSTYLEEPTWNAGVVWVSWVRVTKVCDRTCEVVVGVLLACGSRLRVQRSNLCRGCC